MSNAFRPLRIYSDVTGVGNNRACFLILPWLQNPVVDELLNSYVKDHDFFAWSNSIELADIAVLPFDATCLIRQRACAANDTAVTYAESFISRARKAGTATMALVSGDSSRPLCLDFDIVLRHSIDAARVRKGEYCLPGWYGVAQNANPDFHVSPSPRGQHPILSFCGQAASKKAVSSIHRIREAIKASLPGCGYGSDRIDSLLLRRRVLNQLSSSGIIETSFIERTSFFASLSDPSQAKDEYLKNMRMSDYVLCIRGMGNYSFRFYDALANGRVPVVIDTHCALPYDHVIRYNELIPIIPLDQLSQADAVILAHYNSFDNEEWLRLQSELRRLYLEQLSPVGFFRHLDLIPEISQSLNKRPHAAVGAASHAPTL